MVQKTLEFVGRWAAHEYKKRNTTTTTTTTADEEKDEPELGMMMTLLKGLGCTDYSNWEEYNRKSQCNIE